VFPLRLCALRRATVVLRPLLVVAPMALLAAGCASDEAGRYEASQPAYMSRYPGDPAVAPPAQVASAPTVVIEDDGLPSQLPPLRRPVPEPDDPTEPFSPNYGLPPSAAHNGPGAGEPAAGQPAPVAVAPVAPPGKSTPAGLSARDRSTATQVAALTGQSKASR
jgi:hypothetical protein